MIRLGLLSLLFVSVLCGQYSPPGGGGSGGPVTLTGDATGSGTGTVATSVVRIQGNAVSTGSATSTQTYYWNGTSFVLNTIAGVLGFTPAPIASPTFTGTPSAPTATAGDSSTKIASTSFVGTAISNAIAGTNPAVAALAASTGNIAGTYANGTLGIGATFTVTATGAFTLDGISIGTMGQRVLFKDQSSGFQNGIYTATVVGSIGVSPIFTRALDYNQTTDINSTGAIPIQSGTVNTTTSWLLTSTVNTIGTDALTYVQFSIAPTNLVTQDANGNVSVTGKVLVGVGGSGTGGLDLATGTSSNLGGNPPSGSLTLFLNSANSNHLSSLSSAGTVADLQASSGGGNTGIGTVFTPPPTSGWSWINQGTASVSNTAISSSITIPFISGLNWRFQTRPTSGSYTLIVFWKSLQEFHSSETSGVYFLDGTGKALGIELLTTNSGGSSLRIERINSPTSDNSTVLSSSYLAGGQYGQWVRLRNDGTNLLIDLSTDGNLFLNIYSEAIGTFVTPTLVGYGGVDQGGNTVITSILSWTGVI